MAGSKKLIEKLASTLPEGEEIDCPYLEGKKWRTRYFMTPQLDGAVYEHLLAHGYRRSGYIFYINTCPGCKSCIPIRTDVRQYTATKSQKRALKKNRDIKIIISDLNYDNQIYELYKKYTAQKHNVNDTTKDDFIAFLCESPVETKIMRYYAQDKLIGAGFIDILPEGISSVYFAYDPAEKKRSLGTYSLVKEIEYAKHLGKKWLYTGFYIEETSKMSYKARFKPIQTAESGLWKSP